MNKAAALLGVDETTLRHWADSGKVPVYRTPGGHRRFLQEDIRALMAPVAAGGDDFATALRRRTVHLVSGLSARRMHAAAWYSVLNETFRDRARSHGREVIELLARAVGGTGDRKAALARLQLLGRRYGGELRQAGLTLAQAVEAFTFFRDLVLARAVPAGSSGEPQMRAMREVSRLLDQMLLAIVQAYEKPGEQVS